MKTKTQGTKYNSYSPCLLLLLPCIVPTIVIQWNSTKAMRHTNPLLLTLFSLLVGKAAGYGVDCSFPIHNQTFSDDCGDLGARHGVYKAFMDGCRAHYSPMECDFEESTRLIMNRRQPQSMVNYTSGGFRKVRAPPSLQKLLSDFWENNHENAVDEEWSEGNIYTNHWEAPTKFISVSNGDNIGGGQDLVDAIWEVAQKEVEEWTGIRTRSSSVYGIRVYTNGSILNPHIDRLPLVSSCIVNVAQDVDEDWPLEVYNRFGEAVNITMRPFDMVFYESHSLVHGRPFPLNGRFYANIFIHFEPMGERLHDEGQESYDLNLNGGLPPYILPNSPEAEHWLAEHPEGWSKALHEDDMDLLITLAKEGNVEDLKEYLDLDPRLVNYENDDGWRPFHEAISEQHFETVKFLIDRGADLNARTDNGLGSSPLNLAMHELGVEHPITLLLQQLGAEDVKSEVPLEEEEDADEDDDDDDEDDDDDDEDDDDEDDDDEEDEGVGDDEL